MHLQLDLCRKPGFFEHNLWDTYPLGITYLDDLSLHNYIVITNLPERK